MNNTATIDQRQEQLSHRYKEFQILTLNNETNVNIGIELLDDLRSAGEYVIEPLDRLELHAMSRAVAEKLLEWTGERHAYRPSLAIERESDETLDEQTYLHNAKRYRIGYDKLSIKCEIRDDGSIKVTRLVSMFTYDQLEAIDIFLFVRDNEPGRLNPQFDLNCLKGKRTLSIKDPRIENSRLSAQLIIEPSLQPGDELVFELAQETDPGVYVLTTTNHDIDKRKELGQFGWSISRPTKRLELDVFFPRTSIPRLYGKDVRRAATTTGIPVIDSNRNEVNRIGSIQESSIGEHHKLSLAVDYPAIGLVYLLMWSPEWMIDLED